MKQPKQILLRLASAALTLFITFVLLLLYELAVRNVWEAVFWAYYAVLAAAALFVVIYNRGFSRSFYRREELPRGWSEEQKDAFFAEAADRRRRTRPVVKYLILPIVLCFAFDILCLFLWGPLVELFPVLTI